MSTILKFPTFVSSVGFYKINVWIALKNTVGLIPQINFGQSNRRVWSFRIFPNSNKLQSGLG